MPRERNETASIIARKMNSDGKYHFGATTVPAPHLGQLYQITAEGDGELPDVAPNPATVEEYELWLDSLRSRGFDVSITPINEPTQD